jgi:hypothetical protein
MSDSVKISKEDCPAEVDEDWKQKYMEVIGSLMYLAYMTRPDIAFTCSQLGGMLQNQGEPHMRATLQVLRYLNGTPTLGLLYTF